MLLKQLLWFLNELTLTPGGFGGCILFCLVLFLVVNCVHGVDPASGSQAARQILLCLACTSFPLLALKPGSVCSDHKD